MSEGIPLEQGLRHVGALVGALRLIVSEGIPLEQGLRQVLFCLYCLLT